MALAIKGSSFYFGKQVDAPEASFENFFLWLKQQANSTRQWPYFKEIDKDKVSYTRELFFDLNKNYWYGVFLSAKTSDYQHYVKKINGKVIVEAREVKSDPPVEMNFFCIRKDSCKGIFSHYVGSYQFNTFVKDLWAMYRYFVEMQKTLALSVFKESKTPKELNEMKKISKLYSLRSKSESGPLFDPRSFNQVLDKMRKIEMVRLTTYETDDPDDEPVSKRIRNVHKTYRFNLEEIDKGFRAWVREMRSKSSRTLKSGKKGFSGSVLGFDDEDNPIFLNFGSTMKDFLNYDYDELGTFAVDDIFSHSIVKEMVIRMKDSFIFNHFE